jgi:hypothetical protein
MKPGGKLSTLLERKPLDRPFDLLDRAHDSIISSRPDPAKRLMKAFAAMISRKDAKALRLGIETLFGSFLLCGFA